jgi:putative isomerase
MELDVSVVPFSRFGSYMSFSVLPRTWNQSGLILRTMHGVFGSREVFRVEPVLGGRPVPYSLAAGPTLLRLAADGGRVEVCFPEPDIVRVRGRGVGLRLSSIVGHGHYAFPSAGAAWHVNCAINRTQYLLTPLRGTLSVDARHVVHTQDRRVKTRRRRRPRVLADFECDAAGGFEGSIQEFVTTPREVDASGPFERHLQRARADWTAWLRRTPAVPAKYREAAKLAMYVNWSAVVGPSGNVRRPTMLMSKNWMNQCWSWDHCFNAIALSYRDPDLAWDQLMTIFDHQDEAGVLPDSICAPRVSWNFCKPPVHGWALSKMAARRGLLTERRVREVYRPLARWTEWWLSHRDSDGDGLPEYHHGNDSGWDNATVFDGGYPIAGPDLSGFLVAQMDTLAGLARRLGRRRAAEGWKRRADRLLARMVEVLWNGEQFVSRRAFTGEVFPEGDCLLNFLPVVLGRRLPKRLRDPLAAALRAGGRFLTEHGPATESPQSPLYVPDGYWRGPIWGPEVVLIADGLARGGYGVQAREIARRYCDMCVAGGFAENYDALTGEPLRDRAYTWGASAFLILAHELLGRTRGK